MLSIFYLLLLMFIFLFFCLQFFNHFCKNTQVISFVIIIKIIDMSIYNNPQNWSWTRWKVKKQEEHPTPLESWVRCGFFWA